LLVAEPTRKGVGVYRKWSDYARGYDVALAVAGNKVQSDQDVAFLRDHTGGDLLAWFGHEPAVRAMEQSRAFHLRDLGSATRTALATFAGGDRCAGQGLAQVHPPGGGVPSQERPRVGECGDRRGPGRSGGP